MQLDTSDHNGLTLISVCADRVDAAAAIRFKDAMRAATAHSDGDAVLDLARVSFVDSSGLGAIVSAMKQMGEGRRLILAGLTPNVAKVFRLTRMDRVFEIHDDLAHVQARFPG